MRSTLQRYRCAWRSSGGLSSEKGKAGVKVHFLYDLETFVPAFFHITKASVHDSKVMCEIPYESGSYYVFDRGYNAFKELFKIHKRDSFFIVRAKKNLRYKCVRWRRLPENVLTDSEIILTEETSFEKYPEELRLVRYHDDE
nr:transposase [Tannerella forsythia]